MKKSVFCSLILFVFVSTLFTGCRFGNHADLPQPLKNASTYKTPIELFYTDPHQLESRVYLNAVTGPDAVKHENLNAPLTAIPEKIFKALSSVVYFAIPTNPAYSPDIVSLDQKFDFLTQLDSTGHIAYDSNDQNAYVLWSNQNCGYSYSILHDGSFDRSQAQSIQNSDGSTTQIAGAMLFNYSYSRKFYSINGATNCDADLTFLANCYKTGVNCSQRALDLSKELFDVAVRAGTLDLNDVTKLKAVEYIVHYQ